MPKTTPYRNHTAAFKQQVCTEIRTGAMGRREAQQHYQLSDNLIHQWLRQYDQDVAAASAAVQRDIHAAYAEKIETLERKVGQLVMELERHRSDGKKN